MIVTAVVVTEIKESHADMTIKFNALNLTLILGILSGLDLQEKTNNGKKKPCGINTANKGEKHAWKRALRLDIYIFTGALRHHKVWRILMFKVSVKMIRNHFKVTITLINKDCEIFVVSSTSLILREAVKSVKRKFNEQIDKNINLILDNL